MFAFECTFTDAIRFVFPPARVEREPRADVSQNDSAMAPNENPTIYLQQSEKQNDMKVVCERFYCSRDSLVQSIKEIVM